MPIKQLINRETGKSKALSELGWAGVKAWRKNLFFWTRKRFEAGGLSVGQTLGEQLTQIIFDLSLGRGFGSNSRSIFSLHNHTQNHRVFLAQWASCTQSQLTLTAHRIPCWASLGRFRNRAIPSFIILWFSFTLVSPSFPFSFSFNSLLFSSRDPTQKCSLCNSMKRGWKQSQRAREHVGIYIFKTEMLLSDTVGPCLDFHCNWHFYKKLN